MAFLWCTMWQIKVSCPMNWLKVSLTINRNCCLCKQISANLSECTFIDTSKLCTQEFIGDKTVWLGVSQELSLIPVTPLKVLTCSTTLHQSTSQVFWGILQHTWEEEKCYLPFVDRHWAIQVKGTASVCCVLYSDCKQDTALKSAKREQKDKVRESAIMWSDSIGTNFHALIFAGHLKLLLSVQLLGPQLNSSTPRLPKIWREAH